MLYLTLIGLEETRNIQRLFDCGSPMIFLDYLNLINQNCTIKLQYPDETTFETSVSKEIFDKIVSLVVTIQSTTGYEKINMLNLKINKLERTEIRTIKEMYTHGKAKTGSSSISDEKHIIHFALPDFTEIQVPVSKEIFCKLLFFYNQMDDSDLEKALEQAQQEINHKRCSRDNNDWKQF